MEKKRLTTRGCKLTPSGILETAGARAEKRKRWGRRAEETSRDHRESD
jgi:hypothetical protein